MAGMSNATRARKGHWGGTGDGTMAQQRRHARRMEGRFTSQDIENELTDAAQDAEAPGYWDSKAKKEATQ